ADRPAPGRSPSEPRQELQNRDASSDPPLRFLAAAGLVRPLSRDSTLANQHWLHACRAGSAPFVGRLRDATVGRSRLGRLQERTEPRRNGTMRRIGLTIACWDYDRVRALRDGQVEVEGCDITMLSLAPEET